VVLARVLVIVLAIAPALIAQPAAGGPPRPRETVFSLIVQGGWLMIPIGLCSLIVATLANERAVSLRRRRVGSPEMLEEIYRALPSRARRTREAVEAAGAVCEGSGTIVGDVLRAGVEKIHRDEAHAQTVLEEATAKEAHFLKRRLRPFSIVASLAPLLGLLGTIFGMIVCFEQAAGTEAASRADTLARGIYMALVTTAAGLCVAIPALVVYHYFQGRADRIVDTLEEAATEMLEHYYGAPAARSIKPARVPEEVGGET
jgi:biopolymer transport protein ExbB